jgi:predicted PurR-regulated permease PerM
MGSGWLSRERVLVLALLGVTVVVGVLCYVMLRPFLPALAWALALAIVTYPLHRVVCGVVPHRSAAAALSVAVVAVGLMAPAVFVTRQLVREATHAVQTAREAAERWRAVAAENPLLAPVLGWIEQEADLPNLARQAADAVGSRSGSIIAGSIWIGMQLLITLFVLFYFFRDRRDAEGLARSLVPLSEREAGEVFARIKDTIRATVFGSLVVAAVQGFLGGVMFAVLGLPGPLLWGVVMAVLATVPVMGTFVVWAPAAAFLVVEGSWVKGLVLASWGLVAIGLIDNLLYPLLVGTRLRLHPLPVFFAILGGLATFGAAGIILGPVTLALADALVHVWRHRTAGGRAADDRGRLTEAA